MSERSEQAKAIFLEAVEQHAPDAWPAFAERACAGDAVLRNEVEKLLRARGELGSFHERPRPTVDEPRTERLGSMIGPYKLLQEIGEGGMGTVYMAEQMHPVQRKVALKVIKAGMDSRQIIARFEAERQALAIMDHVNIARVLDAGTTDSGRPYFVMELVHGVPITKYCDDNQLTPRERLELFVPVCHAIQHAHRKGIIHRDVKPSNVMITLYDGKPVPKVIDFGVAKATEQKLTERTLFTQYGTLVGTPQYMSPEQAEMSALGVDTRSDIYSLGVLLYELLTGSTPLSNKRLKEAAYGEILRMIKEEEPQKPSTRLSDSGEALLSISAQRKTEPVMLTKLMRGELDWIVMKTLEKDRSRRYESVSDFAADVRRYLDHERVHAGPQSARYRMRKFVRRNRRHVLASLSLAIALFALAGGFGYVIRDRSARRAEARQKVAEVLSGARTAIEAGNLTLAAQRVAEAQGLVGVDQELLPGVASDIDRVRQDIAIRQRDEETLRKFRTMANNAQDQMSSHNSKVGERVAQEALGLYGVLETDDWLARLEQSTLNTDQTRQVRETVYVTLVSLADSAVRWQYRGALHNPQYVDRSLDYLRRAETFHTPTRAFYFVRSECYHCQGNAAAAAADKLRYEALPGRTAWDYYLPGHTAGWKGHIAEAIRSYRAALALQPDHYNSLFFLALRLTSSQEKRYAEASGVFTACLALRPHQLSLYHNRANCFRSLGLLDTAEEDYAAAIAAASDRTDGALITCYLARLRFYHDMGNAEKIRQDAARIIAMTEPWLKEQEGKPALDQAKRNAYVSILAETYHRSGSYAEAEAVLGRAIECKRDHLTLINNLGNSLADKALWDQAIAQFREALRLDPNSIDTLFNLSRALKRQGRLDQAVAASRVLLNQRPDDVSARIALGLVLRMSAEAHDAAERQNEAVQAFRESTVLLEKLVTEHPTQLAYRIELLNALSKFGKFHWLAGRSEEAINVFRRQVEHSAALEEKMDFSGSQKSRFAKVQNLIYRSRAYDNLGDALYLSGQPNDAAPAHRKSLEILAKGDRAKPNDPWILNRLAHVLTHSPDPSLRDPARALEAAERCVEFSFTSADAKYNLGVARYQTGNYRGARDALQKGMERPGDAWDRLYLAMSHAKLGEMAAARRWYDEAVQWIAKQPHTHDPALRHLQAEAEGVLGIKIKNE